MELMTLVLVNEILNCSQLSENMGAPLLLIYP